jgi:two-component system chemotaxis response regulator CheB
MAKTRVLVVDDSATMRGLITLALRRDPEIEVVGGAADPMQARAAIKALNPDVITLDVEMPGMSGIEFLEKLMRLRPTPVVMVSTLTQKGASATLEALALGAIDCVGKPSGADLAQGFSDLAAKVKAAAKARVRPNSTAPAAPVRADFRGNGMLVAIGASTGGVEALLTLLGSFPKNCPATVITQHMPPNFTRTFAERLNRVCQPEVVEAYDGAPVEAGKVYIARGGSAHLTLAGRDGSICRLMEDPLINGHRPSVDVLFRSVATTRRDRAVGVILTGMGKDGAEGLLAMRQAGARTLGQDEASCVVYGMPKAAQTIGAVEREASITALAGLVLDACDMRTRAA